MSKSIKNNKVSIYLLKPGFDATNVIREDVNIDVDDSNSLYSSKHCKTFKKNSSIKTPSWLSSFYGSNTENVLTAFPKVVSIYTLNIDGEDVSFAVPFGGGKSMLISDSIVDDFGLKVLLNSVDNNQFRQLQMSDCGKNFKSTSSQLPKFGTIEDFSFDINSELLKKAVARTDDELFANNNIVGGEGITITGPYKCDNIEELLIECYIRYKSDNYRKDFPWIDNIREVKDSTLQEELEVELVNRINEREFDKVWMSIPDVIDWDQVSYFRFKKSADKEIDISIDKFVDSFEDKKIKNFNQIKSRYVYSYDNNDNETHYNWPANKCIMCEIDYKDNIYCYNNGKWYLVNKEYTKEVEEYYKTLKISPLLFPKYSDANEKDYNARLKESINGSYLMDCNLINSIDGSRAPIELCDVLTDAKELIHVKKGGTSSYLSHLFNQARVSSDLLYYKEFRKKANEKIGKEYFGSDFKQSDYSIILGIITNKEGDLPSIPFFSKVSIKYLVQDLDKMGYNLYIKNIHSCKK